MSERKEGWGLYRRRTLKVYRYADHNPGWAFIEITGPRGGQVFGASLTLEQAEEVAHALLGLFVRKGGE